MKQTNKQTHTRKQARLPNDVQAPMRVAYLSERSVEDSLSVRLFVVYICVFGVGGVNVLDLYIETVSTASPPHSHTPTNQPLNQQVETSENAWVVLVSYLCMLIYVSIALGRCPDMV